MYTTLIEPAALAAHHADPDWVLLDCRFELSQPDWGARAYAVGHIPHAQYAHLDRDLSGPVTAESGRHPLPDLGALSAKLSAWGVDAAVQVVAYDQGSGAYAARMWWLMRWAGHRCVAVLDGGLAAWQQAGLPVTTEVEVRPPRQFVARANAAEVISTAELAAALAAGEFERGARLLVDARGADRFAGQNETIDPVAGHVPGARNQPFTGNLDQGRFLPAAALRARWLGTLQGRSPAQLVSMCGSGVTACHNLLALEVAGLPGGRLYAGSWSEWIREPTRPTSPPRTGTAGTSPAGRSQSRTGPPDPSPAGE